MDIDDEIIAKVNAHAAHEAKHRPHAGHFHSDTKAGSDLNVAEEFVECALPDDGAPFQSLRTCGTDPPDCEAIDSAGRRIAIEVTDLVDGNAIQHAKRGRDTRKTTKKSKPDVKVEPWSARRFGARVLDLLRKKDGKTLKNGPFAEYLVLIACDEPALDRETVMAYLAALKRPQLVNVHRAYLVLYDAMAQAYALFRLY